MHRLFDAPIICNDQSLDRLLATRVPTLLILWDGTKLPESVNEAMLQLAHQQGDQLIVAKVNVADNPETARRFDVNQTPLLVGLHQGEIVARVPRLTSDDLLEQAKVVIGGVEETNGPKNGNDTSSSLSAKKSQPGIDTRPVHVTDASFEKQVLRSDIPVLVDFWAPWCGPCHMIAPMLDKLARDYAGRLRIAKVNVDENPHYAGVYGVQGIPTLLVVRDGTIVDRLVGALPEQYLRQKIKTIL